MNEAAPRRALVTRALVTGGASPIGAAICRRLAADGFFVIVHAHAATAAAEALAASLNGAACAADLTAGEASRAAFEGVLAAHGPVQVIVHNAGIHQDAPLAGMDFATWRRVIEVSLDGFYAAVQPLLLPMIGTRWGRIVAISSVAAKLGNRGQSNYAAAKAGLEGAVRALAREVASRGITVNAVAPGIIASPATASFAAAEIAALVPMKRRGKPEEVADLVAFLASDRAAYITGQTIAINGGMA
uniref:3-oxoacyl-ACP reductase FabG n=1 Tax=Acidicaldus sp. TaxID=1872105 RepID=A0A8J4M707_9PROT